MAESSALSKERKSEGSRPEAGVRVMSIVRNLAAKTAVEPLDRLVHERMRLGIVSALAVNETMTFNDLKQLLNTTDGNLSVHARRLEDAAYISCNKSFEGRMPKTEYQLTRKGRRALERYLDHMEALIAAMRDR